MIGGYPFCQLALYNLLCDDALNDSGGVEIGNGVGDLAFSL